MAYRAPRHPRIDHHARHQTHLARLVGLVLLWSLALILWLVAERHVPDQHLPWRPLSVVDPVGAATQVKAARVGADPQLCRATLSRAKVTFTEVPDKAEGDFCKLQGAVLIQTGVARLQPADAPLACKEALALTIWERQIVQPAAADLLGQEVVGLNQYGAYVCRRIYGQAEGAVSEHALGNAIDIGAFTLADGSRVTVATNWTDPGPKGQFLRRVRDGAGVRDHAEPRLQRSAPRPPAPRHGRLDNVRLVRTISSC